MDELGLMHEFMAAAPARFPHVRVFRRNIVNADVERGGRHFRAKAGIKGQADLYAIVTGGRHIEIECKAARGQEAEAQKAWRALMQSMSVPHLVLRAHPRESPSDTVERWLNEFGNILDA